MAKDPRSPDRRRDRARLHRQFALLRKSLPWFDGWIRNLQSDRAALIRVPLAILLILGGLVSFLPVLGIWMLPLGLMLLAIDIPALQGPVAGLMVRARRWIARFRRK